MVGGGVGHHGVRRRRRHDRRPAGAAAARCPGTPTKTVAGTAAFVVAGGAAGVAAGGVESARGRPAAAPALHAGRAGAAPRARRPSSKRSPSGSTTTSRCRSPRPSSSAACGLIDAASVASAPPGCPRSLALALAVNVPVASLGWQARTVSAPGAVTGALVGIVVLGCAGPAGLGAAVRVVPGRVGLSSRLGLKRKSVLGIAEERGGRRGAGQRDRQHRSCGVRRGRGRARRPTATRRCWRWSPRWPPAAATRWRARLARRGAAGPSCSPRSRASARARAGAVSLEGTAAGLVAALGLSARWPLALGLVAGNGLWYRDGRGDGRSVRGKRLGATLETRGHPGQRHAELHQHGGGRRGVRWRSRGWFAMTPPRARTYLGVRPAVHARSRRPSAWLRAARRPSARRRAEAVELVARRLSPARRPDGGGAQRRPRTG